MFNGKFTQFNMKAITFIILIFLVINTVAPFKIQKLVVEAEVARKKDFENEE